MKRIIIGTLLFLLGAATTTKAHAQTNTLVIRKEQQQEHRRIKQGVASGELTREEAERLRLQQVKIQQDKRIAKADGVVTPEERARLKTEQNRASRKIYRQKHDAQERN